MTAARCCKILLPFLLILCGPGVCFAWPQLVPLQSGVRVDAGSRTDQLDWSIAGTSTGTNPDILSELTWDDLDIYQFRLHGALDLVVQGRPWFRPQLRAQLGYGRIHAGHNQDSDYDGDNRTLEYSRSNNAADRGNVLDLSVGVGQKYSLLNERLSLSPLLGYSYHAQRLQIMDGYQTIPADGPITGLNSSYDTEWWGPWLGLEMSWLTTERLTLRGLTEYHRADFAAEADWNLRADFAHPLSFEQRADGYGWVNEIGLVLFLRDQWSLDLSGTYQRWQTGSGYDRVFLANGTTQSTRLNRVNRKSISFQVGLHYAF